MKNTAKKILCLAMVLMMAASVFAVATSAEENDFFFVNDYASAEDNGLIYHVNFNGTPGFFEPKAAWAGMNASPAEDGKSVTLTPNMNASGETNLWGDDLNYPAFRMLQSSYTAVFTLSAEDADQELGFFFDWKTGFAITPGKDSFRYVDGKDKTNAKTVYEGTYAGTKALTQIYAIEIKDEGTDVDGNKANFQYNMTELNLYVVKDGAWVKIFSLKDADATVATAIKQAANWDYDNYEYVLRFFRDGNLAEQWGHITLSDMYIYKGLAVTNNAVAVPTLPEVPEDTEPTETEPTETEPTETEPTETEPTATEPAVTEKPNDTQKGTDAATDATEEDTGCASFVGLGGAALITLSAAGAFFVARSKKED